MKTLPRNISAHPDALPRPHRARRSAMDRVRALHAPEPLAQATRLRDRFYKICGPASQRGPSQTPRSNTELLGISETIHWHGTTPRHNFIVHAGGRNKRFYYGVKRPREIALRNALEHRATSLGVSVKSLTPTWP